MQFIFIWLILIECIKKYNLKILVRIFCAKMFSLLSISSSSTLYKMLKYKIYRNLLSKVSIKLIATIESSKKNQCKVIH